MSSAQHEHVNGEGRTNSTIKSRCDDENDTVDSNNHGTYGSIADDYDECTSNNVSSAKKEPITYKGLLRNNSNYRYFLLSYLINKMVSG